MFIHGWYQTVLLETALCMRCLLPGSLRRLRQQTSTIVARYDILSPTPFSYAGHAQCTTHIHVYFIPFLILPFHWLYASPFIGLTHEPFALSSTSIQPSLCPVFSFTVCHATFQNVQLSLITSVSQTERTFAVLCERTAVILVSVDPHIRRSSTASAYHWHRK